MDALQDGWAPLRWCLFAAPMHAYAGRPVKLEAVLANEDVLAPGTYPARLRVVGPNGIAWEEKREVIIPQPAAGEDGPLAVPVFAGDVTIPGPAGQYTFAATLERGGAPAGGRLTFQLSERAQGGAAVDGGGRRRWIPRAGVAEGAGRQRDAAGEGTSRNAPGHPGRELERVQRDAGQPRRTCCGAWRGEASRCSSIRAPSGRATMPLGWLPLKNKGRLTSFSDWLYHKECVAKKHALFRRACSRRASWTGITTGR